MKKFEKLNLQLFATDLKSASTTTFKGVEPIAEAHAFADRTLLEAIYEEYTFEKYCDTVRIPVNSGKTYTSRKEKPYSAKFNELQEGVVPDEDDPMGIVEFTVRLANYGGWTSYTDEAEIYSIDNGLVARIARGQGGSVGEIMQAKVRDAMYSSPNRWFAGVTTIPATLTAARAAVGPFNLDDFRKIRTKLKRAKVKPYDGKNYLVLVSPEIEQSMYDITKTAEGGTYSFLEMQGFKQNTVNLANGEIGTFLNFKFVSEDVLGELKDAEGVALVGASSKPIHGCVILGKYRQKKGMELVKLEGAGAPKTIIKEKGSAGTNDPLNQKGTVGWKMQGWAVHPKYIEAVMIYECTSDISVGSEFDDEARASYTRGVTGKLTAGAATAISAGTKKIMKQGDKAAAYSDDADIDNLVDPVDDGE